MQDIQIRRALISVSKKEGILELARVLNDLKVEILSTGRTAEILKKEGIPVKTVSEFTGFPEILDGRVKTLHPKIHGGLLGRREDPKHRKEMEAQGISPIDLVVVNLYPFEETVSKKEIPLKEAIENIDIGGPSMIRSAAKNFESVAVLVDPADYEKVIGALKEKGGKIDGSTRWYLAQKAFSHTAAYDGAISNYLTSVKECGWEEIPQPEKYPQVLNLQVQRSSLLRYGENPHQSAAFYRFSEVLEPSVGNAQCLHGKELSYNNLLDLNAALETVKEFKETACVIIKHNNPCGVALGDSLKEAFLKAKACDPVSAFGGIAGMNRKVDLEFAEEFNKTFFEALIAPDYEPAALDLLRSKKNLRILKTPSAEGWQPEPFDLKKIVGGLLVQDRDLAQTDIAACKIVSARPPTKEELLALDFAWKVAKHVKSNAIIYAKPGRTVGIGAGQMSRVDSVRLGAMKAQEDIRGSVLASDAFFPFRDGIDEAAKVGITAVIQPGGSVRDEEVIQAANEHNLAMVFTGIRHFRH
ncbi:MAG: bifunctional phosphoribosylaminoimidazolecarboxamide formyltransferase/IMP cyclohydrolase [bacterium]